MITGITFSPTTPRSSPNRSRPALQLILAFLAGIAVIVVLITIVKLHPFLSLIFGALTVGIVAGENLTDGADVVRQGFR